MRARHAAGLAVLATLAVPAAAHAAAGPPSPLDPQNWTVPNNQTWSDYHPLPGPDYSDASIYAAFAERHRAALPKFKG